MTCAGTGTRRVCGMPRVLACGGIRDLSLIPPHVSVRGWAQRKPCARCVWPVRRAPRAHPTDQRRLLPLRCGARREPARLTARQRAQVAGEGVTWYTMNLQLRLPFEPGSGKTRNLNERNGTAPNGKISITIMPCGRRELCSDFCGEGASCAAAWLRACRSRSRPPNSPKYFGGAAKHNETAIGRSKSKPRISNLSDFRFV